MIPLFRPFVAPRAELLPELERVLYSGYLAEGEEVYEFERELEAFLGVDSCLCMSSGTAALHTALWLAGVRVGDEVVSTAMTAEPTNMAILHAGATPVFADVDPESGNVNARTVAAVITSKTRAIVLVHYAGIPVDLSPIVDVAHSRGIRVIEDAAHALGARYRDKSAGTFADFGIFSLQAIKHITSIDGGVLVCASTDDVERARKFRWFGLEKGKPRLENNATHVGYKYNMSNINAAVGRAALRHAGTVIHRHMENALWLENRLHCIPGVAATKVPDSAVASYWLFTVLSERAEALGDALTSAGVMNGKVHLRNDRHAVFAASARSTSGLDEFSRRMLHLPCGWWVSDTDRERIGDVVESVFS